MQTGLIEGACPFKSVPHRRRVRREEKNHEESFAIREDFFDPCGFSGSRSEDTDFGSDGKIRNSQMKDRLSGPSFAIWRSQIES